MKGEGGLCYGPPQTGDLRPLDRPITPPRTVIYTLVLTSSGGH